MTYVQVPKEATLEMLEAALRTVYRDGLRTVYRDGEKDLMFENIWAAMVSAAPPQPEPGWQDILTWRKDEFGRERQALYIGGIFIGGVMEWQASTRAARWRGWIMNDDSGNEYGWFETSDLARGAVEAAALKLLADLPAPPKETKT